MTSGSKRRAGLGVGIALLVMVAVPACIAALFALASFTYSDPPEPAVGTLWAGISVLLLTLPVVAGVLTARRRNPRNPVRSRWGGLAGLVLVGALLVAWRIARRVV